MKTYEIGLLQSAAYRALTQRTADFLAEKELSPNQWAVLGLAHKNSVTHVSEVAEKLFMRAASASELIENLVQKDLLKRKENKDDRRRKDLLLTNKGKEFVETTEQNLSQHMQPLLKNITNQDIRGYIKTLQLITENSSERNT